MLIWVFCWIWVFWVFWVVLGGVGGCLVFIGVIEGFFVDLECFCKNLCPFGVFLGVGGYFGGWRAFLRILVKT